MVLPTRIFSKKEKEKNEKACIHSVYVHTRERVNPTISVFRAFFNFRIAPSLSRLLENETGDFPTLLAEGVRDLFFGGCFIRQGATFFFSLTSTRRPPR